MSRDNERGINLAITLILIGVSVLGMAVAGALFGTPGVFGAGGTGFILIGCLGLWVELKGRDL